MKNVAIIIAAITIIVCVVVLLKGCKSENNRGTENISNITSETMITTTTTEKSLEYVEVTVIDNEYIFHNKKSSIGEIISLANDETVVIITDSNATYNAMSELLSALSKNNISYVLQDN